MVREHLEKSFAARVRGSQDRVMGLRAREPKEPEVTLARQRAEQNLADLERTRKERLAGIERLRIARHGPVRHVASCLVLPPDTGTDRGLALVEEPDPAWKRRVELAAEDRVVAWEEARGRECERVGHQKTGFDVRSLAPPDPQTGYRVPVAGVRRIEVKGRKRGQPVRLTTNEWYKAQQLGDTYWLYSGMGPAGRSRPDAVDDPEPRQASGVRQAGGRRRPVLRPARGGGGAGGAGAERGRAAVRGGNRRGPEITGAR